MPQLRTILVPGGTPTADMTEVLVEIFKNNPQKLPIWVWHRHILTPGLKVTKEMDGNK